MTVTSITVLNKGHAFSLVSPFSLYPFLPSTFHAPDYNTYSLGCHLHIENQIPALQREAKLKPFPWTIVSLSATAWAVWFVVIFQLNRALSGEVSVYCNMRVSSTYSIFFLIPFYL
jgi:hypothetical protein